MVPIEVGVTTNVAPPDVVVDVDTSPVAVDADANVVTVTPGVTAVDTSALEMTAFVRVGVNGSVFTITKPPPILFTLPTALTRVDSPFGIIVRLPVDTVAVVAVPVSNVVGV